MKSNFLFNLLKKSSNVSRPSKLRVERLEDRQMLSADGLASALDVSYANIDEESDAARELIAADEAISLGSLAENEPSIELYNTVDSVRNYDFGSVLAKIHAENIGDSEIVVTLNGEETNALTVDGDSLVYTKQLPVSNSPYCVAVSSEDGQAGTGMSFYVHGKMVICDVQVAEKTDDSVTLTWQRYSQTDNFRVQYKKLGDSAFTETRVEGNSFSLDSLENGSYVCRVKALGTGNFDTSDWGYCSFRIVDPCVKVTSEVGAVDWRTTGPIASVEFVDFEPASVEILVDGEVSGAFSYADGSICMEEPIARANTPYTIELVAVDANGLVVSDSFELAVFGKLAKPQVEYEVLEDGIALNWSAVNHCDGYRVEYAPAGSRSFKQIVCGADETSCVVNIDPTAAYKIRVKAAGSGCYITSDGSYVRLNYDTIANSTLEDASFELVDTIGAVQNTAKNVVLANVNAEGFEDGVEYAVLLNGESTDAIVVQDDQLVYVGRLAISEVPYVVEVVAVSGGVELSDSFELAVFGKMAMCKISTAASTDSVTFTWQEYAKTNLFRVQYRAVGDAEYTETFVEGSSFTIENAAADTLYQVRVKAVGPAGSNFKTSDWSYANGVVLDPRVELDYVDTLSFRNVGAVVATINAIDFVPTSYVVKVNGEESSAFVVEGNEVRYAGGIVRSDETYEIEIVASDDETTVSDSFDLFVNGKLAKAAVEFSAADEGVALQWKAVGYAQGYVVQYAPAGTKAYKSVQLSSEETSCVLDVDPDAAYTFRVKALGVGCYLNSDWSYVYNNYEISNAVVEGPAVELTNVQSSAQNSVFDFVLANVDADGFDGDVEYVVTINGEQTDKIVVEEGRLVYVKRLAISENAYVVEVTASCGDQTARDSFELTVFGKMVKAQVAAETSDGAIDVSWQEYATTDRYRIQYKTAEETVFTEVYSDTPNFTIENAQNDVQYTIRVKAVGHAGSNFKTSDWSYAYAQISVPSVEYVSLVGTVDHKDAGVVLGSVLVKNFDAASFTVKLDGVETDKIAVVDGSLVLQQALASNACYSIEIVAFDGETEISAATTLEVTGKLAKPVLVNVDVEDASLTIEWNAVKNASSYSVQIATRESKVFAVVDVDADTLACTVEDLAPGAYKVRVKAIGETPFVTSDGSYENFEIGANIDDAGEEISDALVELLSASFIG